MTEKTGRFLLVNEVLSPPGVPGRQSLCIGFMFLVLFIDRMVTNCLLLDAKISFIRGDSLIFSEKLQT